MAITVHLFGFAQGRFIVAHCGRSGRGLTTTKVLAAVTCRECKRRDQDDRIDRRPTNPAGTPVKVSEDEAS